MAGAGAFQGSLLETRDNLTTAGNGRLFLTPWIKVDGFSRVAARWFSTGGATVTVTIEESVDQNNADFTQPGGAAGAAGPAAPTVVQLAAPWVRARFLGSVADTTAFRACLVAVD